ncbi:nuclear pore complex protein Nup85-like [Dorcoceras hygrometricum]|uniref:Nuclear pore complex protein Nup85-like n=1 Tax=Dorcoceras hygrometricum TaxID=472368 RepID=A0A2Z7BE28_9LAMI|nr:nuclear pore complex protein Nup85-like [Dorcoceras hygrometricum]
MPGDTPDDGRRHHITCGAWPHVPPLSRILMRGGDDDHVPFMAHSSAPAAPISRNQCARLASNGRPASGHRTAISRDHRTAVAVDPPIRSTTGINLPPSICTRILDGFSHGRNHLVAVIETSPITKRAAYGGGTRRRKAEAGGVREVVERGAAEHLGLGVRVIWL